MVSKIPANEAEVALQGGDVVVGAVQDLDDRGVGQDGAQGREVAHREGVDQHGLPPVGRDLDETDLLLVVVEAVGLAVEGEGPRPTSRAAKFASSAMVRIQGVMGGQDMRLATARVRQLLTRRPAALQSGRSASHVNAAPGASACRYDAVNRPTSFWREPGPPGGWAQRRPSTRYRSESVRTKVNA